MHQSNAIHQNWLESFIARFDGVAGTVHIQRGQDLYLSAAHNIPPVVLESVAHLPTGKGMAGLAQVTKIPVQTCDLQTDTSGNIRPGAKAVNAQAAIALPVLDATGEVKGVVGIAWGNQGTITREQERAMMKQAADMPTPQDAH